MFLLTGSPPGPILVVPQSGTLDGGAMITTKPSDQVLPASGRRMRLLRPASDGDGGNARRRQPVLTVTLPDEIDITNAAQVRDTLTRALDGAAAVLVADAAGTAFCDCAGAMALIRAHHLAADAGTQLRVAASPPVRRMLELTGAAAAIDTYSTLTAAVTGGQTALPGRHRLPLAASGEHGKRPAGRS
jgi:anti-sigma B factor antagonist